MKRRLSLAVIIALGLLLSISILRSQESHPQTIHSLQQPEMDSRQIEHSKLYRRYAGNGDLRSLAAKSKSDIEVLHGVPQKMFMPNSPPRTSENFIAKMARQADAIIVGIVTDSKSFLTTEGTFVFTDYAVILEQVVKNNELAKLRVPNSIIVTRPGGAVHLNGHAVRAHDESLSSFDVGRRYLLFLNYVPSTGAYSSFEAGGAFRINGNKTAKLTKEQLPGELEGGTDLSALIAYVQATLR